MRIRAQDAQPFAELVGAYDAVIALPDGPAECGAFGSFELRGLHIDAVVARSDVVFGLKRSTQVAGYVWTREPPSLRWTHARAGRIGFEVVLDSRVRAVRGSPTGEARCAELTLESDADVDYSVLEAWLRSKTLRASEWRGDARVPLAVTAGGPPVAELDTHPAPDQEAPESVYVLESRARFRRVLYPLDSVTVVGWVPAETVILGSERSDIAELTQVSSPWEVPLEPPDAGDPSHALPTADPSVCAWNAPLAVESGAQVYRVGRLASAVPLVLGARRAGFAYVSFDQPALSYEATQVKFLVPESSLYSCGGRDDLGYGVVQTRP